MAVKSANLANEGFEKEQLSVKAQIFVFIKLIVTDLPMAHMCRYGGYAYIRSPCCQNTVRWFDNDEFTGVD